MVAVVAPSPSRLDLIRERLRAADDGRGVDVLVVRSTDRYLNEYVPDDESTRLWATGFTGSMGDAIVTADVLHLVVDGRYTLQASKEVPSAQVTTTRTGQSIELAWLELLGTIAKGRRVGVEADRVSLSLWRHIESRSAKDGWTAVPLSSSPVEEARLQLDGAPAKATAKTWAIDAKLSGRTVKERIVLGSGVLDEHKLDGLLITALDELAWITNLRGDAFAYQATFRGLGLTTRSRVLVQLDREALGSNVEAGVEVVDDVVAEFAGGARVGVDPATVPYALCLKLTQQGCTLVEVQSPFAILRTKKTPHELAHMADAFARADRVIDDVQKWLAKELSKNHVVTEADVADKTAELFTKSGAFGLSFKVISAAGKNGAIIHYSTPDKARKVKKGELFLLDTGAYYDGGYATDLTRTFLAGPSTTKATKEQKRLYTLVLKCAIAGMSARIPVGSTGEQLDAIVRDALWRHGLDYGHGTGHGVGVNVHEAPPSIRIGSRIPVEVGQVFSIEPGVYLPDWGGVRIENLCTVVDDPVTPPNGVARKFLRVKPLTFSPLDRRLIDRALLTDHEKRFLVWFARGNSKILPPTA